MQCRNMMGVEALQDTELFFRCGIKMISIGLSYTHLVLDDVYRHHSQLFAICTVVWSTIK